MPGIDEERQRRFDLWAKIHSEDVDNIDPGSLIYRGAQG
jgi:hypothetical protein